MSNSGHKANDDLAAGDATPWIGVHVLTEFMFCPRAGLITFEQQRPDTGEELDESPRLDYLPDFSIDLIERSLQETWSDIWRTLTWSPPVALAAFIAAMIVDWRIAFLLVVAGAYLAGRLVPKLKRVAELSDRLRKAKEALPREPDPASDEMQPVNWWELLKAGFSPQQYEDAHEIPEWHFAGRPWRVLVKGSLRIPVFRKRRGEARIRPQHRARMAAYCHLVENAEGGESPYGVVLFGNGHDGITVPNTRESRELFENALRSVRQLIEDVKDSGTIPDAPSSASLCRACPLGRPRSHQRGKTETELDGRVYEPYRAQGEDDVWYHSTCGDRFGWLPPHDRAEEKGLC